MEKFNNISNGVLKLILKEIKEWFVDKNYNDDDADIYEWKEIIDDFQQYIGIDIDIDEMSDVTYFMSLYSLNPNFEEEPIKRPKLKEYYVEMDENVTEYKTYTYGNTIQSYIDLNSETFDSFQSYGYEENIYDWPLKDTNTWDSEVSSTEIRRFYLNNK